LLDNQPEQVMSKEIVILGCTGSIGDSTFRVLESLGTKYRVRGLSADRQVDKLIELTRVWNPAVVCVGCEGDVEYVEHQLPGVKVLSGAKGLIELARLEGVDIVVNGLVGAVGLEPTLAAAEAGRIVAMANKEPLVMAGGLILDAVHSGGGAILPLDSEPNAIWQCLQGEPQAQRLILTASGGAFRGWSMEQMSAVTPQQALRHPTWNMGAKITIDCATLMNKGFEVIEASWLFDVPIDMIDVIMHRESVVHSMVEFVDGSMLAHLGKTDMLLPIQYALTHPERSPSPLERLDLIALGALHFDEPDWERFPCLHLCYEAGRRGDTAPTSLNAANEVAVNAFLQERIDFLDIYRVNKETLAACSTQPADSIEAVVEADRTARLYAEAFVDELVQSPQLV